MGPWRGGHPPHLLSSTYRDSACPRPLPPPRNAPCLAISSLFPPENYPYTPSPRSARGRRRSGADALHAPARPLWPLVGLWLWSAAGLAWTLSTTDTRGALQWPASPSARCPLLSRPDPLDGSSGGCSPALPSGMVSGPSGSDSGFAGHARQPLSHQPWAESIALRLADGSALSSFALPAHLSVFLAAAMAFVAITSKSLTVRLRWLGGVALAVGLVGGDASTRSYGGLAAVIVALVLVAGWAGVRLRGRWLVALAVAALLAGVGLAAVRGFDVLYSAAGGNPVGQSGCGIGHGPSSCRPRVPWVALLCTFGAGPHPGHPARDTPTKHAHQSYLRSGRDRLSWSWRSS